EGLIYKVTAAGEVSILYDAGPSEVRSLLLGPDGALYAGTAAEVGGSGGSPSGPARTISQLTGRTGLLTLVSAGATARATTPARRTLLASQAAQPGGTANPKPPSPGENAVYRIERSGAIREIFRARTLI